jgi:uncharacterized protein (DUF433 family)
MLHELQIRWGYTTEEIVEDYPHLTPEQVEFAVEWFGRAYPSRRAPR